MTAMTLCVSNKNSNAAWKFFFLRKLSRKPQLVCGRIKKFLRPRVYMCASTCFSVLLSFIILFFPPQPTFCLKNLNPCIYVFTVLLSAVIRRQCENITKFENKNKYDDKFILLKMFKLWLNWFIILYLGSTLCSFVCIRHCERVLLVLWWHCESSF